MLIHLSLMAIIFLLPVAAGAEPESPVCSQNRDGIVKDYYPDGKIKTEWMCRDGHLNGETKLYYGNGKLEKNSMYVNDVRQGVTYGYYESGELKSVCNYKAGKLDGPHKILDEDGLIKEFTVYKNGVDVGIE
ncbi:MAG: toxin-antitoxin system YwqK family antitoxin [Deltaproteobacteria bacterium]